MNVLHILWSAHFGGIERLVDVICQAERDAIVVAAVVGILFVDVADAGFSREIQVRRFDPLVTDTDAGRQAIIEIGQTVVVNAHEAVAVQFFGVELVVLARGDIDALGCITGGDRANVLGFTAGQGSRQGRPRPDP